MNINSFQNYILEKKNQIKLLRESIKLESKKTPYPNESLAWPLGNRPGTKPANRFDVIRWDYFTEKYIYLTNDFDTIKELDGSEKLDIQVSLLNFFYYSIYIFNNTNNIMFSVYSRHNHKNCNFKI